MSEPPPSGLGRSGRASVRLRRRVEWVDTDASGHWHNTAAVRLLEAAERLLLERLGLLEDAYAHGGVPRVRMELDFYEPARFNDLLDVVLEVTDVGRTSITCRSEVLTGGRRIASMLFVGVLRGPDGPIRWSDEARQLLLTAGPQEPDATES